MIVVMTTWDASRSAEPVRGPAFSAEPLYRRIAADILVTIDASRLEPGAALPSEAELCAAYGVSRITIRKAIDELVARQVVDRRRGSGTYISSTEKIGKAV